jgi:hypothetical protein
MFSLAENPLTISTIVLIYFLLINFLSAINLLYFQSRWKFWKFNTNPILLLILLILCEIFVWKCSPYLFCLVTIKYICTQINYFLYFLVWENIKYRVHCTVLSKKINWAKCACNYFLVFLKGFNHHNLMLSFT